MTSLYSEAHLALQEEFGTTRMGALMDQGIAHDALSDDEQAFITSRDLFFLSTVDPEGMPTVSYKGGPVGFVRVMDPTTLVFPGYDGNGMFYSLGNIVGQGKVGLLFIDFETPHRLRVQGTARYERSHPLLSEYPEAKYLVFVTVQKIWVNCPRYIHTYRRVATSKYVPGVCDVTPLAVWKRIDIVQEAISPEDQARAASEGLMDFPSYESKVKAGEA
jgi:uncharacterized protein